MAARLPVPNGDSGTWGTILNDYLQVSLDSAGNLKSSAVSAAGDSRYVQSSLIGAANGVASLDSAGHLPSSQLGTIASGLNFRGAWTTNTAYAIHDLLTFSGDSYAVTAAFTSGVNFSLTNLAALTHENHIYNALAYGVKGDNTNDDTAAIKNLISTAITNGQADGSNYAEIYFPPAKYLIAGAPTQGGATKGNAQIPLPIIAPTVNKFTLVLRSISDGSALPHWQQTVPQANGATFVCNRTDGTDNVTYGAASVLGGPTVQQGYGISATFSNMLIVIDGITIQVPQDSSYCGFDFRGVAEVNVKSAAVLTNATPAQMNGATITRQWTWGLAMPLTGNNDNCTVGTFSCEGLCYGFMPSEHTMAQTVRCIYCIIGIEGASGNGANMPHGAWIGYASAEYCVQGLGFLDGLVKLDVAMLDCESVTNFIYDPSNKGVGTINCFGETPGMNGTPSINGFVNGGDLLKIIDHNWASGTAVAPVVPASNVAWGNGFWRNAAVNISGGTVSSIVIDGATLGITAGTVIVPAGKNITITYSSVPTWTWILL